MTSTQFKAVSVVFQNDDHIYGSKEYDYLTFLDDLKIDDLVVVETRYGYKVAKISDIKEFSEYAKSFVIDKIDLAKFIETKQRLAREAEIRRSIEAQLEEEQRLQIYREAAQSNTNIADLLAELEALRK